MDVNVFFVCINLFLVLMIFLSQIFAAVTARKTLLFGVRVPEGAKKEADARKITRIFYIANSLNAVFFAIIVFFAYLYSPRIQLMMSVGIPLAMMIPVFFIYVSAWKKAKVLKKQKGWKPEYVISVETSLASSPNKKAGAPLSWYISSIIICVIFSVTAVLYLPYAPDMLPMHWGPSGQADSFAPKSVNAIIPIILLMLGIIVLMYASSFIVARSRLQRGGKAAAVTAQQGLRYKMMMQNYLGFLTLLMTVLFGLMLLMTVTAIPSPQTPTPFIIITILFLAACLIPVFYIMIKAGQSGEKLAVDDMDISENTVQVTTADDDHLWKFGMFYYNKDDPSWFLENRFGNGWDMNYARPFAWLVVTISVAVLVGAFVMLAFIDISTIQ